MRVKKFERGKMMKRVFKGLIVLALVLMASLTAVGFKVASGDNVVVDSGEVIEENYTFAGSYFEHNGVIKGNLYATGEDIIIKGDVEGNVFAAGSNIVIYGTVSGDVYAAGQKIEINGQVAGNVFAAGNSLDLQFGANVGHDIFLAGNTINMDGKVNGDGYLTASRIIIRGSIAGDLNYGSDKADIGPNSVMGNTYKEERKPESAGSIILAKLFTFISFVFSVAVIWAVVTFVLNKDHKEKFSKLMEKENVIITIFLYGLVALIASFFLPLLLMITGIGLKLGIFTMVLNTAFMYFAVGLAIVVISGTLSKKLPNMAYGNNILIVLALAVAVGLLKAIPIIAGLVTFPLLVVGYGLIIGSLIHKDKKAKAVQDVQGAE